MNIRKKLTAGALALGVFGGAGLITAPAASANDVGPVSLTCGKVTRSYGKTDAVAAWNYNDKQDYINAVSNTGVRSSVKVSPVIAGKGPTFTVAKSGSGWSSSDRLKYAFEDAKYKAVFTCTNLETGKKTQKTFYFFT